MKKDNGVGIIILDKSVYKSKITAVFGYGGDIYVSNGCQTFKIEHLDSILELFDLLEYRKLIDETISKITRDATKEEIITEWFEHDDYLFWANSFQNTGIDPMWIFDSKTVGDATEEPDFHEIFDEENIYHVEACHALQYDLKWHKEND